MNETSLKNQKNVRKHFEDNFFFVKHFWMNKNNLSLHMGFWDEGTKTLGHALMNTNKYVAQCLNIKKEDKVLDVGCGIGGTAIWIAEQYGAKVLGIDLVPNNIKLARKNAKDRHVDHLVMFKLADCSDPGPAQDKFDKIIVVETFSYIYDKCDFISKMYENLNINGKLLIIDYLKGQNIIQRDADLLNKWCNEWAIPSLMDFEWIRNKFEKNKFKEIQFEDKTRLILKSNKKLRRITLLLYPITLIFYFFRLISDYPDKEILIKEPHLFKNEVIKYGSFECSK